MSDAGVIAIGKSDQGPVRLDVARLVKTRLLVTANSGGGKSWLLRLLAEQLGRSTQLLVLDREGEFVTLRELLDVVLVGPTGEIPTDVRSAGLLVRRLMEKHLSAVIDMSEMPLDRQRAYVRAFCEAMVHLPKSLWRPCFIVLDEIHLFCPEKGAGEAESREAVINLITLGRKRGYCTVGATQRVSKFHKDAAAELLNKFIGRTSLDLDQKRAGYELGIGTDEARALRELSPAGREGEFYAYGPALLIDGVAKLRVGAVKTTHPEAGQGRTIEPPKPSRAIADAVSELTDLPQQAEEEIRDLTAARGKIAELQGQLRRLEREQGGATAAAAAPKVKELQAAGRVAAATIARLRKGLEDAMKVIGEINAKGFDAAGVDAAQVRKALDAAADQIVKLVEQRLTQRNAEFERLKREANQLLAKLQKLLAEDVSVRLDVRHNEPFSMTTSPGPAASRRVVHGPAADPTGRAELTPVERDVLDAAASFPQGATKQRISIFSGRSIKSSSFDGVFAGGEASPEKKRPSLVQRGLLRPEGDRYVVTEAGAALAEPTAGVSLEDWLRKLTPTEADVLRCLAANTGPETGRRMTRADVSEATGRSAKSSSFDAAFPSLRDLGLIEGRNDFAVVPSLLGHHD